MNGIINNTSMYVPVDPFMHRQRVHKLPLFARAWITGSLVGELVEQHPHDLHLHLQVLDVARRILEQLAEPARLAAAGHQPPQLPHLLHQHPTIFNEMLLARLRHRLAPATPVHPLLGPARSLLRSSVGHSKEGKEAEEERRLVFNGSSHASFAQRNECPHAYIAAIFVVFALCFYRDVSGRTCACRYAQQSCVCSCAGTPHMRMSQASPRTTHRKIYSNGTVPAVGETRPLRHRSAPGSLLRVCSAARARRLA